MSALRFNAAEILDIAIRIEQNGAAFYRKAAASRRPGENTALLLELAAMEDEHQRIFAKLRDALPQTTVPDFLPQDDEAGLYLDAMADYHGGEGSIPATDRLTGHETLADVISIAIDLELKSILYYDGLRQLVPAELGRDRVDAVIAEERRHVAVLRREQRLINNPE